MALMAGGVKSVNNPLKSKILPMWWFSLIQGESELTVRKAGKLAVTKPSNPLSAVTMH